MNTRAEAEATLRRFGENPSKKLDIAEGALCLALLDSPRADPAQYREHIARLSRDVAVRASDGDGGDQAATLADVISGRHGYRGDDQTYDDLQNANLMRVIDRRMGLPVALGILYIHAARAQNWTAFGLNFPGHFLIAVEGAGQRAILDPFHEGRQRTPPEMRELLKAMAGQDAELEAAMYAPVGDLAILLRLQSNVKLRLLQMGRIEGAARIVDSMLMLMPRHAGLWRESALLLVRQGKLAAATQALETAIEHETGSERRHESAALLQDLRRRIN